VTRDDLLLGASLKDLWAANSSPEMISYFEKMRAETILIKKMFYMRNMSEEKKKELEIDQNQIEEPIQVASSQVFLDDDD
jgi:hypothetical protein